MKNTSLQNQARQAPRNAMALQLVFQQKAHQAAKRLAGLLYLRHEQTGCLRQVPYPEAYHDALDCMQASAKAILFLEGKGCRAACSLRESAVQVVQSAECRVQS